MKRIYWIGVAVLLLVGAVWLWSRHKGNEPKIPIETQRTLDSLKETSWEFKHQKDSIIRVVVYDTVQAIRAETAARQARARAQTEQHRADSLAMVARTSTDSASTWRQAYEARTAEAVELRTTVAAKDSAYRFERDARQALSVLYGADTTRRIAIERVNADLVKAIARLEQPCRVIGPIPCPSRTASAILAGTLGAIAGNQVKR